MGKRTHRKILVVDGKVAYTGGLGIDKRWLGDARNKDEWRDTQVRAEGPVAAQMQSIFSEDWTYTTGEILVGDQFYPKIAPAGAIRAQAIKASRGDSSSLAKMLYYVAIQSAKQNIYIANAYFLPDKQVREALARAVQRGVDVQVMVPGSHNDMPMVRSASWAHYGELLKAGVRIFEYQPTMLHNKTLVVDHVYATIGSINFDARSMNANAEESLAFYDRSFAGEMEAMFLRDRKRCREITYGIWDHRGPERVPRSSSPGSGSLTTRRTSVPRPIAAAAGPLELDFRRPAERLHDDAVLFGLRAQRVELIRGCRRGDDVETYADGLESDRDLPREAERAAQVHVAFHDALDPFGRNSHRGRDHLAGDLRARRQGAEQQIPRASGGSLAADARVRLRRVGRPADVDGARDRRARPGAAGAQCDSRRPRVGAIAILERFLKRLEVHWHSP